MNASDSDDFEIVDYLEVAKDVVADKKPDLAKIKTWLKPTEYTAASSEFNRHLLSQSPGTGEWIRETTQFCQWYSSDNHGSIWIKAVPGAGKSVVAASMVDSLVRHESVPVLFFFFRQIIESNRTARSLLRDWLCQLLPSSAIVQALLWELADKDVDLESISTTQLWKYLLAGLRAIKRVYCVIDALDEMNIDQDFLSQLNDLGSFRPAHVKVLMTSRPKQYLQRALRDPQVIHVALEEELVKRDVSVFAGQRVTLLEQYGVDKDTQELIKNTVLERSAGLFLYARLMLDQIEDSVAQNHNLQLFDLRDMITKLPVGLEDMYNKVLSDISTVSTVTPETQSLILSMVTQSVRPLRLIEIAYALGSENGDMTDSRSNKDIVRMACGPLLEIMEDEVVQILHHSFTEFLLDTTRNQRTSDTSTVPQFPVLDPVAGHGEIAMTCLSYLQSIKFTLPEDSWNTDYSQLYLDYPFFEYSAINWTHHAARCSFGAALLDKLEAFCAIENPPFNIWVKFTDQIVFNRVHINKPWKRPTALHIASCFGLTAWVKALIRKGANVDTMDSTQSTALLLAARNGFPEIVELLLEAGASPDLDRYDGLKPLHVAAKRNHVVVVKLLVNAGVSPTTPRARDWGRRCGNAPTSRGDHPLMYAVNYGHLESVIEMIPFSDTSALNDSLCWAASGGHTSILRSILENSEASANAIEFMRRRSQSRVDGGRSALMLAVRSKEPQCVKILLDHGADVLKIDERKGNQGYVRGNGILHGTGRTALHEFALRSFDSTEVASLILKLLLAAGANLEACDNKGNTPLLLNCGNYKNPGIVTLQLLIEAGADVRASDRNGETLLHRVCSNQQGIEAATLLLDSGANPRAVRRSDGSTPFHCAAARYSPEIMKLLLDHGADINTRDSNGNTALHQVCSRETYRIERITELLIGLGADVNIQNDFGRTCLHALTLEEIASYKSSEYINAARALIDAGADLRLTDREGLTVLLSAVKHLSHLLDCLLEYPSKISIHSCIPPTGKSILHIACQYKQPWAIIKTLANSGADIFAVDHNGNTLLHEIAQHYLSTTKDAEIIGELVKLGVPIHAKNFQGRNAIHFSTRGHFNKLYHASLWTRDTFLDVIHRLDNTLNVNSRDIEGYTPLHFAVVVSEAQAYALIRAGADLSAKANNLRTPLHCAARARQPNIISIILHFASEQGLNFDINTADEDGRTAMHDACRSGIPESVKFLLDAGADINKPDNGGITPLVACTEFQSENARWRVLQQNCATEVSVVDDFRFTQTHRLYDSGNIANFNIRDEERTRINSAAVDLIASMLIKAGATGVKTALDKAVSVRCAELVYVLRQTFDAPGENAVEPDQSDNYIICPDPVCNEPDFRETALMLPITNMSLILEQYKGIGPKERITSCSSNMSQALVDAFLANDIDLISKDPNPNHQYPAVPVIQTFVRNGRTDLMRKLLEKAQTGEDRKFSDALHAAVHEMCGKFSQHNNLLQIACERATDNMEMVKLLVENFDLDVNAKDLRKHLDDTPQRYSFTTALHSLASGDNWWHVEAIRYLVGHGAEIDIYNGVGKTPLELACKDFEQNCHYSHGLHTFAPHCAEVLLKLGADPNCVNAKGLMPLNIVWKDIELAKILVQYGADPAKGPKSGIISATELGAVELLKFFLEESLDCNEVDRSPSTSRTYGWDRHSDSITINPLLIAALPWKDDIHNVSVEMTQLLMKHGAKLDVKISEAQTLLHYIMENLTDPDIFAPFLESKTVDFGLRDQNGLTAFMAACKPPHNDQKFQGTKAKSILIASSNSHGSTIDYQAVDNDGNHVLMHLIPGWTSELSDFFLNKPEIQAVINQKNKKGFSPFHYALLHDKYFACHTFLAAGADITDPDPDGNSALHYICKPNCRGSFTAGISLFKNYLDCGGSIDARNANGETPLIVFVGKSIYAEYCREGREEHIPLFSSHGANFNVARNDGRTALHIVAADPWSSFAGAAVLFKALVECGADPLQEDGEGRTALDLAAAVGNANILEMYQRPGQRGAEGMRTSAVIRRRRTRETSRTMLAL